MNDFMNILRSFEFEAIEVEPRVYKILNPEYEVVREDLQEALHDSVALVSKTVRKKDDGCFTLHIVHFYYVFEGREGISDLIEKYFYSRVQMAPES